MTVITLSPAKFQSERVRGCGGKEEEKYKGKKEEETEVGAGEGEED